MQTFSHYSAKAKSMVTMFKHLFRRRTRAKLCPLSNSVVRKRTTAGMSRFRRINPNDCLREGPSFVVRFE
jgi:hypothetical protein